MTVKCSKCGSDVRFMVQATLTAPGDLYGQFSKKNLRRKDVYLAGVNWETADLLCQNPDCRQVHDGYGNYVSRLEAEVKRLKAQYEPDCAPDNAKDKQC